MTLQVKDSIPYQGHQATRRNAQKAMLGARHQRYTATTKPNTSEMTFYLYGDHQAGGCKDA